MSIKTLKNQGGFTLLELLIVIVIIGILALLIIPNITSAPKKARDTKRKTDIAAIRKGLEDYYVSNNSYPAALTDLEAGSAPILKPLPADPKSGWTPYTYTVASDNASYTISACLENNQDNGTNVIAPVSPCTTKTFQLINGN